MVEIVNLHNLGLLNPPHLAGIVCHDAGASNVIAAWIAQTNIATRIIAHGPAEQIMSSRGLPYATMETIEHMIEEVDVLITGTGWATRIEYDALRIARNRSVPSIALLDHWVNFSERFIRDEIEVLPDNFWVTDIFAEKIACKIFDKSCIFRTKNFYFDEQLAKISCQAFPRYRRRLLYILEPTRSRWGREEEGEFQALDYFISKINNLALPKDIEIVLRPHPSEVEQKYQAWVARHPALNVIFDDSPDIAAAISKAEWVAGCESSALILALAAGRTVLCTLPPWAPTCRLPQAGLIHLKHSELIFPENPGGLLDITKLQSYSII